jgi:hypothetical protein
VSIDALSNEIAERCSRFQAPFLPSRWYPLQLAKGKKLPTRHIGCRVLPIDRPFRDYRVFGAQDRKLMSFSFNRGAISALSLRLRFSECFLACSRHQIGMPMRSAAVCAILKFFIENESIYPSVDCEDSEKS